MSANRFGHLFTFTSFGESHGEALGCVIDGCPAGVEWNQKRLTSWLERRRPGQSTVVSARNEPDQSEVLSGVFESRTLGTPIAILVRNADARSKDYSLERVNNRPGHAADLWHRKFGHSDHRGSGRASGRETVSRVMAGAVAEMFVRQSAPEIRILGFVSQIGAWQISEKARAAILAEKQDWPTDRFTGRLPDETVSLDLENGLIRAKEAGESYGGICEIVMFGLPEGLGQPVFHKLKSDLTSAMMSVGATSGVDFGEGFLNVSEPGSGFHNSKQTYGGLRGGISTGDPVHLRIAFKPASTLGAMAREGRHDPAILPRALPVLEAMAWLVIADHIIWRRLDRV